MKVGDLYYALGIRNDAKSFDASRRALEKFGQQAERTAKGIGARINRALFGAKGGRDGSGRYLEDKTGLFGKGGAGAVFRPDKNFGKDLRMGMQGAALGVGAAFGLAVKDAIKFDEALTRLDISSSGAMGSMEKVRAQVLAVSKETGVAKEELVGGAAAFVALTGDGQAASQSMKTFARVQKATGANMHDIAGSAASLNEQLGISGPQFEDAFSILIAGGKAGKIELNDMASLTASLGANFKQFAGSKGLDGLSTLGSAFQITARNFGSASEAATGLESLMGSIIQHSGKLKEAGVNVFEKDGKTLKSLEEIVDKITSKGFNPTQLIELLGRKEAYKALQALRDNRAEWRNIAKETRNAKDVSVDYEKFQQSSAARMQKSWNDLKITISEALSPERVDAIAKAVGGLVGVLGTAAGMVVSTGEGIGTFAAKVAEKFGIVETKSEATLAEEAREKYKGMSDEDLERVPGRGSLPGLKSELRRRERLRKGIGANVTTDATRFLQAPTMMERDAANPFAFTSNLTINAPPGLDAGQVARLAAEEVDRALEGKAREIEAHLGGS